MRTSAITAATCFAALLLLLPASASADEATYVGSKKCKRCHGKIYKRWKSSWHHNTLRKPSKKTVIGDFSAHPNSKDGIDTRLARRGKDYTVTTIGPSMKPETFQVRYVMGGKRVQQLLTKLPSGSFHVLPAVWDVARAEWKDYHGPKTHRPTDRDFWSSSERVWNRECAGCHTTGLKVNYDKATDTYKTEWVEDGVGCEACHGPGSRHIRKGSRDTIVPMKRLSFQKRADVCGQCHSRGVSRKTEVPYPFPVGYLPGERLSDYFDTVVPRTRRNTPFFWGCAHERDFHQEYLGYLASKHYAKRAAVCETCHNPHGSKYPSNLTRPVDDNTLCYGCHKDIEESLEAHTHHSAESPGSVCTSCHMTSTIDPSLNYDVHTHTFWVPSSTEVARYKTPSACGSCHPAASADWMKEKMAAWK